MPDSRLQLLKVAASLVALLSWSCERSTVQSEASPDEPVAAVVNGRPITEREVNLRMRERGPTQPLIPREQALEALIVSELQAQRAEGLGLDKAASFLEEMEQLAARTKDVRRQRLAKGYRLSIAKTEPVPEATLRAFFDANQELLRTELKVKRLMVRQRSAAEQVTKELSTGQTLDAVALNRGLPAPEVATLNFEGVPATWWTALEGKKPGEASAIIDAGPEQFVVLELVERRELPAPTYEAARAGIERLLQGRAFEQRMARLESELKQGARIERRSAPETAAATPAAGPTDDT